MSETARLVIKDRYPPPYNQFYTGNVQLSEAQMKVNARYLNAHLGWTPNAVAGLLGNLEVESWINPGVWQNLDTYSQGFGLCQWTPYTKYTDWCEEKDLDPSDMDSAILRLDWELANGEQWIPTESYPETFEEFIGSYESPYYLAQVFLNNYERPAESVQPARSEKAEKWFEIINSPFDPNPQPQKRKEMDLMMLLLITNRG